MQRSNFRFITSSFFVLVFVLISTQCKKDKDEIPNAYVDFYINVTSTQYIELNNIGGYAYLIGGVRGIIVYRRSVDEFMAYERNCSYQPYNTCAIVEVDNSAVIAVDSCCGSRFLLLDGSIVNGPATKMLKHYETSFDGTNLHIFN